MYQARIKCFTSIISFNTNNKREMVLSMKELERPGS